MNTKIESIKKLSDRELILFGAETPKQTKEFREILAKKQSTEKTKIELGLDKK